jgi:hypothetical protein
MQPYQNDDVVHELRKISAQLEALSTVLINYVVRAEKEVPEYLRRLSMYYSDMVHAKYLWEEAGHQFPDVFKAELDRTHHRIEECIGEETSQGGTFHKTMERYKKEGKTFGDRRRE